MKRNDRSGYWVHKPYVMEEKIGNEMLRLSFSCKTNDRYSLGKLQERCCTERSTRLICLAQIIVTILACNMRNVHIK